MHLGFGLGIGGFLIELIVGQIWVTGESGVRRNEDLEVGFCWGYCFCVCFGD